MRTKRKQRVTASERVIVLHSHVLRAVQMTAIYTEFTAQFRFINTVALILYWHALQQVFIPLLFTNLWDDSADWMKIAPVGFNPFNYMLTFLMSAKLRGVYFKMMVCLTTDLKTLWCALFFQVLKKKKKFSVVYYCQLPFHCLLITFRSEKV